jgi:hypothetical protein
MLMSVVTSSPLRKLLCSFLAIAFVLFVCLSGYSPTKPPEAKAQFGEFLCALGVKLAAGLVMHTCDWMMNYFGGKEGPDVNDLIAGITDKLEAIDAELKVAAQQVKEIIAELKELEFYDAMEDVNLACSRIETFWTDEYLQRFATWNGTGWTPKKAGEVSQDTIDHFIEATNAKGLDRPLENDFNQIATGLTHPKNAGDPRGALDSYTDKLLAANASASTDFSATVESTNGVGIVAERPMYFNYGGKWDGGHCQAGSPQTSKQFYFAEGTTRPAFESYICISNPGSKAARVKLTYMRGDSSGKEQYVNVAAHSRLTVNAGDILGRADAVASDFSTRLESVNGIPVVAERPIYFKYGGVWTGGHCNLGVTAPAASSFLAEGTCRNNFDTYLCVQNPGDVPSRVRAIYYKGDGTRSEQSVDIPPRSRSTLKPSDVIGRGDSSAYDFSTRIETLDGTKVVVERPVYFNYKNAWLGGHCESGRVEAASKLYFAEGTVRPNFHSYICLANHGGAPSNVKVTFMRGDGSTQETTRVLAPGSRQTINAGDVLGQGDGPASDFSAKVETTDGTKISAERVMYFDYRGPGASTGPTGWTGGHCERGLTAPANKFYFAEGTVRDNFVPYLCIANPENRTADVTITYMLGDGGVKSQRVKVPPHSRQTVNVSEDWNNMQVSGRGDDGIQLEQDVKGLEYLFSKLWLDQLMALDMNVEALNYVDPTRGKSQYWLDHATEMFKQEALCYLDNVDRLVNSRVTMSMQAGKPIFQYPAKGQYVIDRANYLYEMICQQAINRFKADPSQNPDTTQPVIIGTVMTTKDINAPHVPFPNVTAVDTTAGSSALVPSTVESVGTTPPALPFNGTVWQKNNGIQLLNSFYDVWQKDEKGKDNAIVDYSSDMSITKYIFSGPGIVKGHTYDILDKNKKKIASTVVNTYDDDFNPVAGGPNVFGGFSVILSNNSCDKFLDSANWGTDKNDTEAYTQFSTHGEVTNTCDFTTQTPKWVKTQGTDSYDQCANLKGTMNIGRTFRPYRDINRAQVWSSGHTSGSLHVNDIMDGGNFDGNYAVKVVDTDALGTKTEWAIASGSMTINRDSKNKTLTMEADFNGSTEVMPLYASHTYFMEVRVHVNQNPNVYAWGPNINLWMKTTLNNSYISILQ